MTELLHIVCKNLQTGIVILQEFAVPGCFKTGNILFKKLFL